VVLWIRHGEQPGIYPLNNRSCATLQCDVQCQNIDPCVARLVASYWWRDGGMRKVRRQVGKRRLPDCIEILVRKQGHAAMPFRIPIGAK
jgi:hypothetical protein